MPVILQRKEHFNVNILNLKETAFPMDGACLHCVANQIHEKRTTCGQPDVFNAIRCNELDNCLHFRLRVGSKAPTASVCAENIAHDIPQFA